MNKKIGMVLMAGLFLCACTTTKQKVDAGFQPPPGSQRVIVLEPAISVELLTTGGLTERREDWTLQARRNVTQAVTAKLAGLGAETKVAMHVEDVGGDTDKATDLVRLHAAVEESIRTHKYGHEKLPTKEQRFDWTLGAAAADFGTNAAFDYALFLQAEQSFASRGRKALQIGAVLSCSMGVCYLPLSGKQVAFASLVELKTGRVVWSSSLKSRFGDLDLRSPQGAERMVGLLLNNMPRKAQMKNNPQERQ